MGKKGKSDEDYWKLQAGRILVPISPEPGLSFGIHRKIRLGNMVAMREVAKTGIYQEYKIL